MKILHIDASPRTEASTTRKLTQRLVKQLGLGQHPVEIIRRDLAGGLPLLDEATIGAFFTPEADRSEAQRQRLALSDALVDELEQAEIIVIGTPIYNFSVPAALKAWIDLVARAQRTFRYTKQGPVGLLADRPVYLVVTSGGTPMDAPVDFATPYLRHVLGFLGLHDVRVIDGTAVMRDGQARITAAESTIDAIHPFAQVG